MIRFLVGSAVLALVSCSPSPTSVGASSDSPSEPPVAAHGATTYVDTKEQTEAPTGEVQTAALSAAAVQMQKNLEPFTPPGYQLLDVLVWGNGSIDLASYSEDLRIDILRYQQRYEAYRPLKRGTDDGLAGMAINAQVRYERRLAAISELPDTAEFARTYVAELSPCYEWEGYSDCPEREARFAADYRTAHLDSPFRDYLPLLEAHRWICAAEGFEYEESAKGFEHEKAAKGVASSRDSYKSALSVALASRSGLVRVAAAELAARNRCHL